MKRIKVKHKSPVCYVPTDAHQAASLILLNRYYARRDTSCYNWMVWLRLRDKWMTQQEEIHGKVNLTCSICGKTNLDPWTKDMNKIATIDHIIPVKRAPHLWAEQSNFQITCYQCNQKKGCS